MWIFLLLGFFCCVVLFWFFFSYLQPGLIWAALLLCPSSAKGVPAIKPRVVWGKIISSITTPSSAAPALPSYPFACSFLRRLFSFMQGQEQCRQHPRGKSHARVKKIPMEHLRQYRTKKKKGIITCLEYNRSKISWQQTFMHLTAKKKGPYRR